MARRDRILRFTLGVLRLLLVLNMTFAVAFLLAALASLPFHDMLATRIGAKYPTIEVERVVGGVRALLLVGAVAAVPAHIIFSRLIAVLHTVLAGETFAAPNARRVRAIAWALLAIQLLDVPLLLILPSLAGTGVGLDGSSFSIGGWLSVLVAFVLARVFAEGAALREDLEGTV